MVAVGTLLPKAGAGGEGEEGGLAGGVLHPRAVLAQLLSANGFSPHRQARLKLVHAACCRLAGLAGARGGGAGVAATAALAAAGGGKAFVVTPVPGTEPGSRSKLDIQQEELGEDGGIAG